jgi:hypothetical protein
MIEENKKPNDSDWEWLIWLVTLIPLTFMLWLIGGWWLPATFGDKNQLGIFGDRFGAINALFSGLAFAGLIVAIMLQRRELELQRRELRDTRDEFRRQRQQMEAQNLTLRRQTFENTFFQLLRAHNDIVNAIDLRDYRAGAIVKTAGRDCFRIFYARVKAAYAEVQAEGERTAAEAITAAYEKFFEKEHADVGHYFSQLHDILEFVHASDIEGKAFYASLLRGQLSTFELAVLFYHCLGSRGAQLKARVEEFAMLRALPQATLIAPAHKQLYQAAALGAPGT